LRDPSTRTPWNPVQRWPEGNHRGDCFSHALDASCIVGHRFGGRSREWSYTTSDIQGIAIGRELRAMGGNYFGGVCVNLAPNPKWGRAQESYGEDPLLIGSMGSALSRGAGQNVVACVKHLALNSMEKLRFDVDVTVADDVLHECYLPHFRQCLESGAESVMSAYNKVNGEYCGESRLLNGVLRDTWGYEDVLVTSDWLFGFRDVARSVNAGLDVEMPHRAMRVKHLPGAIKDGRVEMATIDRIAKRVLRFQLNYQARIAGTPQPSKDVIRSDGHRALARRVAGRSMVLLKNDNLLPLRSTRLLVIGKLATSTQTGDDGSSAVRDPDIISPLKGLEGQHDIDVTYLDGKDLQAVETACGTADAVFLLVGYTAKQEGEYLVTLDPATLHTVMPQIFPFKFVASAVQWTAHKLGALAKLAGIDPAAGGDRDSLRLLKEDEELATAVARFAGNKMVLGLETSGPVLLPKALREKVNSILVTGYGGSQFGPALREVLFGVTEPAGRLAYGIVETETDIPDIDMNSLHVTYGRYWGYRATQKNDTQPAYPFGFGLGYGRISFISDSLEIPRRLSDRFFQVTVTVRNDGKHTTSGVVQIYCGKENPGETDYKRVLIGFARSRDLEVGGSEVLDVECRLDPVAHWSKRQTFEVAEGRYRVTACKYEGDEEGVSAMVEVLATEWSVKAAK
jgi:beta-glucosidase